jgi:3-methyl-2-oxobutanoate hydroxymethyltransferase
MSSSKISTKTLQEMKLSGQKITAVVTYSYTMARRAEEAGIEAILVGDSATRVFSGLGQHSAMTTLEMLYHTQAVTRACSRAWIMADLPQEVIDAGSKDCVEASKILIIEGKADCVKVESNSENAVDIIQAIHSAGFSVMGHFGMLAENDSRIKKTEKDLETATKNAMLDYAKHLVSAGSCALLLSKIKATIAAEITHQVSVATIGIGSGMDCDGQILVLEDLLGLTYREHPYYVKQYAQLGMLAQKAIQIYIDEVKKGVYPNESQSK